MSLTVPTLSDSPLSTPILFCKPHTVSFSSLFASSFLSPISGPLRCPGLGSDQTNVVVACYCLLLWYSLVDVDSDCCQDLTVRSLVLVLALASVLRLAYVAAPSLCNLPRPSGQHPGQRNTHNRAPIAWSTSRANALWLRLTPCSACLLVSRKQLAMALARARHGRLLLAGCWTNPLYGGRRSCRCLSCRYQLQDRQYY